MKHLKINSLPALLAVSVLSLSSCEKDPMLEQDQVNNQSSESLQTASGEQEYIVTLKQDTEADAAEKTLESLKSKLGHKGLMSAKMMHKFDQALKGYTARLTKTELEELKKDGRVESIEADQPVFMYQTTGGTTTTSTSQIVSWGTTRVGLGTGVGKKTAWIIDTGIDKTHPDLNVDLVRSRSFLKAPVSTGTTITSPWDERGHGTNVAGIIGAKDNGIGARGVAAGAKLVSLRVMDKSGAGTVSAAIAALNYVATNGVAGDVVNMSLGASPSASLDAAVRAVADKGIFVVIAAGNSSANAANYSPARVNHARVFTVSGFRTGDVWNPGSNFGSTTIDYTAPGSGVYTTAIGGLYKSSGGTSMASPHVAGLLLAKSGVLPANGGLVTSDPDGVSDKIAHL